MDYKGKEARTRPRTFIEPYDTGTYLVFSLGNKSYRFTLLDTSPGGMGMLVKNRDEEVLNKLRIGRRIRMEYKTPEASLFMNFEIKHITQIHGGRFNGHYQIGLSLYADSD